MIDFEGTFAGMAIALKNVSGLNRQAKIEGTNTLRVRLGV
jgi:hypothetical protein